MNVASKFLQVPGGSTEFFTKDKQSDYAKPCDGMTEYYAAEGITIRGTTANVDALLSKAAKASSVDALLSEELAHAKLTGGPSLFLCCIRPSLLHQPSVILSSHSFAFASRSFFVLCARLGQA